MNTLFTLCVEFFKTGLFAVGGGLATVPFLKEMANNYGWFTIEKLMTMIAVSESTPGPIGINMATYVGYETVGLFGGILSTLSLIAPSIIVSCLIFKILDKFKQSKLVQGIFTGLRPAVVGFVLSAVISIFLSALFNIDVYKTTNNLLDLFDIKAILLFIGLYIFSKWQNKLHPIYMIAISAILGVFIF